MVDLVTAIHKEARDPDLKVVLLMESIIDRRYSGWRDIITPDILRWLAICTGGDLRDFFRLIRECTLTLFPILNLNLVGFPCYYQST